MEKKKFSTPRPLPILTIFELTHVMPLERAPP